MPKSTKCFHRHISEITRPKLSPEKEAEICGLRPTEVQTLLQRLEEAPPGPEYQKAWDDCVQIMSVPLSEAATALRIAPVQMSHRVRQGSIRAFQHRSRWRMWTAHLLEDMEARGISLGADER